MAGQALNYGLGRAAGTIQAPFLFQKGQRPEKVILDLIIGGTGADWIDDGKLSME